ncbi:cell wall glucanase (Scw4) [Hirsutella rhossiliensis]
MRLYLPVQQSNTRTQQAHMQSRDALRSAALAWDRKQKRASLSLSLVPLRAVDELQAVQHPNIRSHGIHVFLDMSNINISFQQTLRAKYSVHESARFTPLPSLDLGLLTEILVRERRVVALNAGCSVLPGKPAPRFIQDLQDRGYHVDLRERKRVVAGSAKLPRGRSGAGVSSSDEMSARAGPVRYVEDLVDETLQTRIAESVMEYFQAQGTLVIATGDAQPAKYSDGFFTYAERALKMGWNVEVVSWRRSLSSCWKGSEWTTRWGNRFRIIELDEFVDDLLACQL